MPAKRIDASTTTPTATTARKTANISRDEESWDWDWDWEWEGVEMEMWDEEGEEEGKGKKGCGRRGRGEGIGEEMDAEAEMKALCKTFQSANRAAWGVDLAARLVGGGAREEVVVGSRVEGVRDESEDSGWVVLKDEDEKEVVVVEEGKKKKTEEEAVVENTKEEAAKPNPPTQTQNLAAHSVVKKDKRISNSEDFIQPSSPLDKLDTLLTNLDTFLAKTEIRVWTGLTRTTKILVRGLDYLDEHIYF